MSLEDRNKMRALIDRYAASGSRKDYQAALDFGRRKGEDVQAYLEMLEMVRQGVDSRGEV